MPELPEVETIKQDLQRHILGKRIKEVIIKEARSIKEPKPLEFKKRIQGQRIKEIKRRGKVLSFKLTSNAFIVIHLRLTGWFTLTQDIDKAARVIFKLSKGTLNFCDPRLLGELRLVKDWQDLAIIKKMGPEPLDISEEDFILRFTGKKTKIKPLIMDQHFLAGIGNIYTAESLFCAGIHPGMNTNRLSRRELVKLYTCLIQILKAAIRCRGSSVDTYRDLDGREGRYVNKLQVYGRANQPCYKCRTPIKRIALAGRGTYFCPKCQK